MEIVQYSQKNVFLISGMFAGNWIWKRCYKNINANINMMAEPLCHVGEDLDQLSEDIAQAVSKLNGKVVLVGNSLGSLLCLKVASMLGDKIELVIISGSAGFGDFPIDLKLKKTNPEVMRPDLKRLICHDQSAFADKDLDRVIHNFGASFRPIVKLIKASSVNIADSLIPKVKARIVAIWGDNDLMTPYKDVKPILDKHGIDSRLIKECGHSPMYERPLAFSEHVNACLN